MLYRKPGLFCHPIYFRAYLFYEVCEMLKGLSPRKATGLDDLPARSIRDGAEGIDYPISYIINLSLKTGVVPNEIKLPELFHCTKRIPN